MNCFKKIFNPEVFQGQKKTKNYFEGWYFKIVDKANKNAYAIIPGVSLGENEDTSSSFIQVIDGIKGETYYFEFKFNDFIYDENVFKIEIKGNVFSDNEIHLNLKNDSIHLKCDLYFYDIVKMPKSIINPGIMGFFSYFSFMECYHGLVNAQHLIKGTVYFNDRSLDFNEGYGYIEKDWGKSFPNSWIWLQGNNFNKEKASFMLSIAEIPFLGMNFIGFLGYLYFDGEFHRFSTYNFSSLKEVKYNNETVKITIKKRSYELNVLGKQATRGVLKAPKNGNMKMTIEESINAVFDIELKKNGKCLFKDQSVNCGMEVSQNYKKLTK